MALFNRKSPPTSGSRSSAGGQRVPTATFGPGRRLNSQLGLERSAAILEQVLTTYSPPAYAAMSALQPARVEWRGPDPAPARSFTCTYGSDDIYLITMASEGSGTLMGLFPVGADQNSLTTPLVGQWKQADGSLSSTGTFQPGSAALHPPEIPLAYVDGILEAAEFDGTSENKLAVAEQVVSMFNVKAYQYISSNDLRSAETFVAQHSWTGDPALCSRVLADLGAWNQQVIPYIQDLPGRVRALLLESDPGGRLTADVWERLPRRRVAAAPPPLASPTAAPTPPPPADTMPRCGNQACSNFGHRVDGRQCPVCFHYIRAS